MMGVSTIRRIFTTELQQQAVRKVDVIIGFFFLWVPILLHIFLWQAVYDINGNAGSQLGYTLPQMITYFVLTLMCQRLVGVQIHRLLNHQIIQGDLNRFMVQPLSHLGFHYTRNAAEKFSQFTYLLVPAAVLLLVFRENIVTPTVVNAALFALALLLSIALNFLIYYALGLLGFWFGRANQIMMFATALISLIDGSRFPLSLLPTVIQEVSWYLPFQYIFYFPIRIFIGAETPETIRNGLLIETVWIVIFYVLVRIFWSRGLKRFGAFGG
ncbi:ABC-2 family transporter protein [Tumebacillus sp. DT12]|uniref:ABC-2 family transporter protein n=1 Tax=Tumebacillus lacus TaxID=2995335 RepID=A0ABT3WZZ3_9BACL|nr:ABC-2 family transporter protein [Tumebacillus lacus]MCX7570225.1 ABC-2 family transporter protein [Tumebacillus lacus]